MYVFRIGKDDPNHHCQPMSDSNIYQSRYFFEYKAIKILILLYFFWESLILLQVIYSSKYIVHHCIVGWIGPILSTLGQATINNEMRMSMHACTTTTTICDHPRSFRRSVNYWSTSKVPVLTLRLNFRCTPNNILDHSYHISQSN